MMNSFLSHYLLLFLFPICVYWMNEDFGSAQSRYLLKGNILSSKKIKTANTLYETVEDVYLAGNAVMPEGCTLIFCGGIIREDGRLEGKNTRIIANDVRIFDEKLEICGKWEQLKHMVSGLLEISSATIIAFLCKYVLMLLI